MLVDDEVNTLSLMKICIDWNSLGFEISAEASSGKEALEILKTRTVDVVITDIEMPFINGFELSVELRNSYPDIIIIILTAYDSFEYAKSAIKLGVSDFILKPINRSELTDTLRRIRNLIQNSHLDAKEDRYFSDILPYNRDNLSYDALNGGEYDEFYKLVTDTFDRLAGARDIAKARYHCRAILEMLRTYFDSIGYSIDIMTDDDNILGTDNILLMIETVNSHVNEIISLIRMYRLKKENIILFGIINYIHEHAFDEKLSLGHVSARFFINSSYLSRIMSQHMGISFVDYVNTLRIEQAKKLLRNSDRKAYEISVMVGFVNSNYFSKCFKKYTGEGISEYKNKFH